jgi:hypothetical protein
VTEQDIKNTFQQIKEGMNSKDHEVRDKAGLILFDVVEQLCLDIHRIAESMSSVNEAVSSISHIKRAENGL